MFITSITLCCFILSVQSQNLHTQNPYYALNQGQSYFPDSRPQGGLVSQPVPNLQDKNLINRIYQDEPTQQKKNCESPSVEVERSNEIAFSTSIEQVTNRQTSSQTISKEQTVQQNVLNRETVAQTLPPNSLLGGSPPNSLLGGSPPNSPLGGSPPNSLLGGSPANSSLGGSPPNSSDFNNLLYAVTNFGINLLQNIDAIQPGNAVVSPYSIISLLALLQQGALGNTQEQITTALQMSPATSASSYSQVAADFKNRNSRNILKTANKLFIADGFTLNDDFKKVAVSNFDSDVMALSYARPDLAARQINSWVASRTANKIERLISPDALDISTQVVLVNAIYFKGLWEVPFRVESTLPREFELSNGKKKTTQFMRIRKLFKTGIDPATNAKVIILPFERDQYSLMVVLPSRLVGFTSTLSSLSDARLLSYHSFTTMDTELELPKFTVRADTDLTVVLRNMGITNIFEQYAELSGIGTYQSLSPQISSAVHSAVLSIDEQGGSAAAATAFAAVALSYDEPAVIFKANRPFIAVLWDTKTSLPLFMAKIEDPQQ